jgi:hypothetical protein
MVKDDVIILDKAKDCFNNFSIHSLRNIEEIISYTVKKLKK